MKAKILFVLLAIALLISACSTSVVVRAYAEDWIWGIEEMQSGATRVWLRYDDLAGYCTTDEDLGRLVKDALGDKVRITFESVRWNEESGCAGLYMGTESSTAIFRLTGVERIGD